MGCAIFLNSGYRGLNQGISLTHAHQVQNTLREESDVLAKMVEPEWLGLTADDAKHRLTELGLFSFEKGTDGLAAGPVFLRVQDGKIVEIQAHCARLKSAGCKDEGVN